MLLNFWLAYTGLFVIITIASALNANLHHHLDILIPWLKETFRPALLNNAHPDEARDLQKERLPILEEWNKACLWYGGITFVLQLLLFLLGALVVFNTGIPYILLMVIVMLLGSLVMFFPRTVIRRSNVKQAIGFYFIAYAGLMVEIKEKASDGDTGKSGTNSHS
jgi:hypothetical protein